MTELSFLLELLMEHRLEKKTKILIKDRIAEIQVQAASIPSIIPGGMFQPPLARFNGTAQAPSMAQKIAEFEAERGIVPQGTVHAQTPAAAQALAERQKLINQAINGQEEKGRSSPRKF